MLKQHTAAFRNDAADIAAEQNQHITDMTKMCTLVYQFIQVHLPPLIQRELTTIAQDAIKYPLEGALQQLRDARMHTKQATDNLNSTAERMAWRWRTMLTLSSVMVVVAVFAANWAFAPPPARPLTPDEERSISWGIATRSAWERLLHAMS